MPEVARVKKTCSGLNCEFRCFCLPEDPVELNVVVNCAMVLLRSLHSIDTLGLDEEELNENLPPM
jgi:hypothetical protein